MKESKFSDIEDLIFHHIPFIHGEANGWHRVYCNVCGDGSRTKGPRAGFLFESGMVFYHCFNQGCDGSFDPGREQPISKGMRRVFEGFGIPIKEVNKLLFNNKLRKLNNTPTKKIITNLKKIEIPDYFYKLNSADLSDKQALAAKDYLNSRKVDFQNYDFYLSSGITKNKNDEKWANVLKNRIIIPLFYKNEMVYYIARSLDPTNPKRYINAPGPKNNIIYGFDRLYDFSTKYLFITEGFFDAYHVKGIAVLENYITSQQIEIINKSPKEKILIPDRHGDSQKLIDQAKELGWKVTFPDIGDCKDISQGIERYGKLFVLWSIMNRIKAGKSIDVWKK